MSLHRLDAQLSSDYDELSKLSWIDHWIDRDSLKDGQISLFFRASGLKPYTVIRALWTLGYPDLAAQQARWLQELGIKDPRHG
jgi:hypothetical protein